MKAAPVVDLIDLGGGGLDDFFADAPAATASAPEKPADKEVRKKGEQKEGKKERKDKEKKSSSKDAAADIAMDRAALDERIQRRKEEKDAERAKEALAKLEAMCGGSASRGEEKFAFLPSSRKLPSDGV